MSMAKDGFTAEEIRRTQLMLRVGRSEAVRYLKQGRGWKKPEPCKHIYGFIDFNALPPGATMAMTITTEEETTDPYVRTKDFLSCGNGGLKCNYCPECGEKL